jgi:hypothetical protein
MTVIAWDGKTLAADKCATSGGGIARPVTKICRGAEGELVAMTGDWDVATEMRAWYLAGAVPEEFPAAARDGKATLIVFTRARINTFGIGPYPMPIESEKCAFGSGRDYAEAAMFLGHDAEKGVRVASHFQTDCGNGIDTLDL